MSKSAADEALARYHRKRDFSRTPEPRTGGKAGRSQLIFVVQKHHASHLHYDFRLELDGTLKSWAVPKGPCLDPAVKRMAVEVEDHPLSYARFEGTIPPRQYGAGTVIVWDEGHWVPDGDAREQLATGKLKFELKGTKLRGRWTLVRMHGKGEKQPPWLLIKERDDEVRALADYDILEAEPDSVLAHARPKTSAKAAADAASGTASRSPARKATGAKAPARKTSRKVALPATLAPQLATLATDVPAAPGDWLYELKFDGYRLLTRIDGQRIQCFTRNGHDWTGKLPGLVKSLATLPTRAAWLDGEITVEGADGAPDFQALQNAFDEGKTAAIDYWLFDVPFLDGADLRELPIEQRRAALAELLGQRPPASLRLSEAFDAPPADLLASSARIGFEGIVAKRKDSTYVSRRSADWLKLKNQLRQEFVIGGWTAPRGARSGFGALLLGVYDDRGVLQYCGNVGTGFDARRLADITAQLEAITTTTCPFGTRPAGVKAQWTRPRLVAEVAFGTWTREGKVRHAVFQGLRTDKTAGEIRREAAQDVAAVARPKGGKAMKDKTRSARVTNADRVIDAQSGITKGELVAYYDAVQALLLPHLRGRPVSLVRAPEGVGGELFFQKHAQGNELPGVKLLDPALDPGHEPLLQIDAPRGLASATQLNVIEFHTWNANSRAIARPDRMTFDLDPGEGVEWQMVQEAAMLVRTLLDELGLPAFLKTSGGKGLHVVVPLRRHYGWDAVKGFSQAIVQHLARTIPSRFVAKSGPRNRVGKIFVDYLRNGFGATTVAAWSARARPGLGVSVPLAWEELPDLRSGSHWTVENVQGRLAVGNAPWATLDARRTSLGAAFRTLGYTPPPGP